MPRGLLVALIPVAYLIGSIPFGLIVGLAKASTRKAGSGNIGATNVGRLLGGSYFALVFTLDMLKGLIPMLVAALRCCAAKAHAPARLPALAARRLRRDAGHMFSVFLGFNGGKGVATSAGVLLGLWPVLHHPRPDRDPGVFVIVFKARRYVSLASIVGCGALPGRVRRASACARAGRCSAQLPLLIFAIVMAALIVYKHRTNIARLRAGTENRFEKKSPPTRRRTRPPMPRDPPARVTALDERAVVHPLPGV